jgi:hypothetical protein
MWFWLDNMSQLSEKSPYSIKTCPQVCSYVLRGMAKSSHEQFNEICNGLVLRKEVDKEPPAPGQNVRHQDFKLL